MMTHITRTTRQLARPRIDSVDGEFYIEPAQPAQHTLRLLYAIIALLIITTGMAVTYCAYLLLGGI